MIEIPLRKCFKNNCENLIPFTQKYCDEHKDIQKKQKQSVNKFRYENDKKVLSVYNNSIWRNVRKSVLLRDNGLCLYCLANGYVKQAQVVDHFMSVRDDYDKRYDTKNLVSACYECNNKKSLDEELLRNKKISIETFKNKWKYGDMNE